jgi:hypothetical protein
MFWKDLVLFYPSPVLLFKCFISVFEVKDYTKVQGWEWQKRQLVLFWVNLAEINPLFGSWLEDSNLTLQYYFSNFLLCSVSLWKRWFHVTTLVVTIGSCIWGCGIGTEIWLPCQWLSPRFQKKWGDIVLPFAVGPSVRQSVHPSVHPSENYIS